MKCNKTHIKLPCISEDEISRTINFLKNASAGWDNIPSFVVKKVSKHVIRPLTYLINKSIEQGIFPDELKVAKVFTNQVTKNVFPITDPFLYCHFFPKYLKGHV